MKKFLDNLKFKQYEYLYDEVKKLLNDLVCNSYDCIYLQGCIGCGKSIASMLYSLFQCIENKQDVIVIDNHTDLAKRSFESTINMFESKLIVANNFDTIDLCNGTKIKFIKYTNEIYNLFDKTFNKKFFLINDLFETTSFNYLNLCKFLKQQNVKYMTLKVNYDLSDVFDYFVYEEEKQTNTYVWRNVPFWKMKSKSEYFKNEEFIDVNINGNIIQIPLCFKNESNIYQCLGIPKK